MSIPLEFFNYDDMRLHIAHGGTLPINSKQKCKSDISEDSDVDSMEEDGAAQTKMTNEKRVTESIMRQARTIQRESHVGQAEHLGERSPVPRLNLPVNRIEDQREVVAIARVLADDEPSSSEVNSSIRQSQRSEGPLSLREAASAAMLAKRKKEKLKAKRNSTKNPSLEKK